MKPQNASMYVPFVICSHVYCIEGEEGDVRHQSERAQLEKLLDDKKKQAALISQTRVSYILI